MRQELINKLFKELYKENKVIRHNLLLAMNEIVLVCENEFERVTLTIKIENN